MRALLRLAGALLLCAAATAPTLAAVGEIAKVEGDVMTLRVCALSGLEAGSVVTIRQVPQHHGASCRGTVVSTDPALATLCVRLEGPKSGIPFASNACVRFSVLREKTRATAERGIPAAADRSTPPVGRFLAPSGRPSANARELRVPMEFPLDAISPKRR